MQDENCNNLSIYFIKINGLVVLFFNIIIYENIKGVYTMVINIF